MIKGIRNYFVIENIFGKVDIFEGAKLTNLIYNYIGSRLELRFEVYHKVINPSKRWEKYDRMEIVIDFQTAGVLFDNVVSISLQKEEFFIKKWSYKVQPDSEYHFLFEFYEDENNFIKFVAFPMQISNISPIVETGVY